MAVIRWLHLSDLHFQSGEDYDSSVVLRSLLRDLRPLLGDEFGGIDLVFVTGDIGWSGSEDQYSRAKGFFDELLDKLNLPRERLYVVPGNHDVDRKAIGAERYWAESIASSALDPRESRARVAEILTNSDTRRLAMRRLRHYETFVSTYLTPSGHLRFSPDDYYGSSAVAIDGVEVAIFCLNSVWLSASDSDRGRLILGERQVRGVVEGLSSKPLRIALIHHPLEWMADWDRNEIEDVLLRNSDFVLHGHRHWQAFKQEKRPGAEFFVFASGAGYEGRHLINTCNAVRLDLSTGDGAAVSLRYSDQSGGFWVRDVLSNPDLRQEVYRFRYPRPYVPAATTPKLEVPSETPQTASPALYLEQLMQPGMLQALDPNRLVDAAREAPVETIDFLRWISQIDRPFLRSLLVETGGRLLSAVSWHQTAVREYTALRNELVHDGAPQAPGANIATLQFVGPIGGPVGQQLHLQIPKKDSTRPRLAGELRFSLYLANLTGTPIQRPQVTLTISAGFLGYSYQVEPLAIEPSEYWAVTRQDVQTFLCVYSAPSEYSSVVESGRGTVLGTIAVLMPWGEADQAPVDLPITYVIEGRDLRPVQGRLIVTVVAALEYDEAKEGGHTLSVPANIEAGADSGIDVTPGQVLRFAAQGVISFDAENHFVDADGRPVTKAGERLGGPGVPVRGYFVQDDLVMRGQPVGALVGWLKEWTERGAFLVGTSSTFVASTAGRLHLGVNDVRGTFGDNSGSFEVAVKLDQPRVQE